MYDVHDVEILMVDFRIMCSTNQMTSMNDLLNLVDIASFFDEDGENENIFQCCTKCQAMKEEAAQAAPVKEYMGDKLTKR